MYKKRFFVLFTFLIFQNSHGMLRRVTSRLRTLTARITSSRDQLKKFKIGLLRRFNSDNPFGGRIVKWHFDPDEPIDKYNTKSCWSKHFENAVQQVTGLPPIYDTGRPLSEEDYCKLYNKDLYVVRYTMEGHKEYLWYLNKFTYVVPGYREAQLSKDMADYVMEKYLGLPKEYQARQDVTALDAPFKKIAQTAAQELKKTGKLPKIDHELIIRALGDPKF